MQLILWTLMTLSLPVSSAADLENTGASWLGAWECSASHTMGEGERKVSMTQRDHHTLTADGMVKGGGTVGMKVATYDAKWTFTGGGTWRVDGEKFCSTVNDLEMAPANDHARELEKRMGKPMKDSIPLGKETCKTVVEKTAKRYVTVESNGVRTVCKKRSSL